MRFSTIIAALTAAVFVAAYVFHTFISVETDESSSIPTPPHVPQEIRNDIAKHIDKQVTHHKDLATAAGDADMPGMEHSHKSQGKNANVVSHMLKKNAGPRRN